MSEWSEWAKPHIDVASHPVWDEGQWKLSGWACLERFMGTTSARAAGGSPLTMLWLLLWTINRCSFLFSSPPSLFLSPSPSSSEASFTLQDGHSPPIWIWQTYHETWKKAIMVSWLSKLNRITEIWMWGRECIQKLNPRRVTANGSRRLTTFSKNQTLLSSNLTVLDHRLLNNQKAD